MFPPLYYFAIAHVALRKRHQRQDEIIISFTCTILESAKLFFLPVCTHFIHCVKRPHLKEARKPMLCSWIALSVTGVHCMRELKFENNF